AYQVLGDPQKRQKYDQFGSAAFEQGGGGGQGHGFGGFDFSGFQSGGGFEDLGDMFGSMFGGGRRGQRERRGQDIQVDVDLSFKEAVFGVEKQLNVTKHNRCERCASVGAEPGTDMRTCDDCDGNGVKVVTQRTILGNMQSRVMCSTCDGTGEIPKTACSTCGGDGLTRGRKTLTINIPSGVDNGNVVRVRGEGEAIKGGASGDLLLRVHVAPDRRFDRDGATIFSRLEIGFTQAALGATVDVETVDGPVELKIPAATQSGTEFRLRGKGVPHRGGRGDHLVSVQVITPKKLSREQKKLLEDLDLR
ncbi:MAG: J domain-containing protein, partial [Patescibacteria group bacterium]